jgi:hypothetical protein
VTAGKDPERRGQDPQRQGRDPEHHGQDLERHEWPDRQAVEGPFTTRQLLRLDQMLRDADRLTGLAFSVYVGDLAVPVREAAEKLHAQLADPARSVLVAVSPNQRVLEIVTGPSARWRLPDRECKLAALSMVNDFGKGNLAGGIITGLAQLTDHARFG